MRSHDYNFNTKDVIRVLIAPVGGLLILGTLINAGIPARVLPPPRPALDADRTILVHQADAARLRQEADIVLIGDSSCLMDVMADQLTGQLRQPVLNLGTSSFLDLDSYGRLLQEFVRANPGRPRIVVLLMHPEALRRPGGDPRWKTTLEHYLDGTDDCPSGRLSAQVFCHLGLEPLRARVLSRLIPSPLPFTNEFGRAYRFTVGLEEQLTHHRGSLPEPAVRRFTGNAEYRLSSALEKQVRGFTNGLPTGSILLAGITPVPAGFVGRDFADQHSALLEEWSRWLGAKPLKLPATMDDELFGRVTHLNPEGAGAYTQRLAGEIQRADSGSSRGARQPDKLAR